LLWALKRLKDNSDFVVSLETIDDVTFETPVGLMNSYRRSTT